ncbi:MAG: 16S rRNA (cytidine(1402)-2'-O)-methyltransferase [Flavobacteriales bacterium]|nr:16S rRNA (cytidine(1402)-2'-O)-methyltransferase [Flavobacteriales bacterium]
MLYILPTPIGNLKDITIRALDVLKEVDIILAEDTRQTKKLLNHYEITTSLDSLHQHNEHKKIESVIAKLAAGITMAQVSDAGTPGISDPGFLLIRECLKNDIKVECLPGATAFVPALVKSGLPCDKFVFEGFLPHKKGRQTRLKELAQETRTIVFYESPYRLVKTLKQFAEYMSPERQVSVSRELTKIYEETKNGTVTEVAEYFEKKGVKGEIVIILKGAE